MNFKVGFAFALFVALTGSTVKSHAADAVMTRLYRCTIQKPSQAKGGANPWSVEIYLPLENSKMPSEERPTVETPSIVIMQIGNAPESADYAGVKKSISSKLQISMTGDEKIEYTAPIKIGASSFSFTLVLDPGISLIGRINKADSSILYACGSGMQ